MRTAYERGAVQSRTQTICFVVHARKTAEDLGTSAAPCRFSARDSEYSLPSSDVTTLISRCCDFQIAVSSTSRNRSFNPPYFRLLACAKSSLLYLQQSRWVLWCTHVGRMMAFSLQHGFWPTRNVPASISVSTVSSAKNASWMISLWSEATWSYSGGISGEIVRSSSQVHRLLTARGHIHENILLDKFLLLIRISMNR